MKRLTTVIILVALGASGPAAAQDERSAAEARTIKAFTDCRAIADGGARLACFDAAAAALEQAVAKKEVVILDKQDVRKTKRSLFGFNLPKLPFFGGGEDEEEADTAIDSTVRSVRNLGYDKIGFTLEDGALWQTTEPVRKIPKPGAKVHIKRAALGGYFISFDGRQSVRGMRVN